MLVLIIVIIAVGYLVSLRIHPLRKCPRCNMSGRHFGAVFPGSYRRCRKCQGRGQLDRVGTQVFYGGTKGSGVFPTRSRRAPAWPGSAGSRPRPRAGSPALSPGPPCFSPRTHPRA